MIIQHFKYPFQHTIIYDIFDEAELARVYKELEGYCKLDILPDTGEHHKMLFTNNKTTSFSLDEMHHINRSGSDVLTLCKKVYELANAGQLTSKDNPFLRYIPMSNQDSTFVQLYRNGSSYFDHSDGGVLTFLYPFKRDCKGGELIFTEYNYTPHLTNNCCLIFPSFERHRLTPVEAQEGLVARYSINQRIFIRTNV